MGREYNDNSGWVPVGMALLLRAEVSGNIRGVARLARPKNSRSPVKRRATGQPPPVEELMCELMGLSKAIRRFMEQRFVEHDFPASLSGPRMGVLFQVRRSGGLRIDRKST